MKRHSCSIERKSYPIAVHLFDCVTGTRRVFTADGYYCGVCEIDEPFKSYIWEEGNYSCDHNRADFWNEGSGEGEDVDADDETQFNCLSNRFAVEKIVDLRTGDIVYREDIEKV